MKIATWRNTRRRRLADSCILAVVAAAAFFALSALGTWQLQRRAWKHELIAEVDARVRATPEPPPPPALWPSISAGRDAYRHVRAHGYFLNGRETLVQAVTTKAAGFWVMTPLVTDSGFTVLVNRGFIPAGQSDPANLAARQVEGDVTVTGLLRMSEPGGGFLRTNAPAEGRWYSRDVAAIAAARGVSPTAPYFIDADGTPNPGGLPISGLTVIRFADNHLIYALTWYGLAMGLAAGCVVVAHGETDRRRAAGAA